MVWPIKEFSRTAPNSGYSPYMHSPYSTPTRTLLLAGLFVLRYRYPRGNNKQARSVGQGAGPLLLTDRENSLAASTVFLTLLE
jgi:hypothetical protein